MSLPPLDYCAFQHSPAVIGRNWYFNLDNFTTDVS